MWRTGRLLNHGFRSITRITKGIVSMPGVMMAFLLATTCARFQLCAFVPGLLQEIRINLDLLLVLVPFLEG